MEFDLKLSLLDHSDNDNGAVPPLFYIERCAAGMQSRRVSQLRRGSTSIFFHDGKKSVDFVLAYQPKEISKEKVALGFENCRRAFEQKLMQQGLTLEYEDIEQSQDEKTCFVKIHAPFEVLARTAEINRIKMPISLNDMPIPKKEGWFNKRFQLEDHVAIDDPQYFSAVFTRDRVHQFLMDDKSTFFTPAQRIRLVWDLLLRTTINPIELGFKRKHVHMRRIKRLSCKRQPSKNSGLPDKVGINWLVREDVYVAAYPLHDGDPKPDKDNLFEMQEFPHRWPLRRWLYETWARPGRWRFYQPLTRIRNYYGEKVAIYFAWLGFYTKMLVIPSILGILCFIYGIANVWSDTVRNEFCDNKDMIVCRLCPKAVCPFKPLNESCFDATISYVFDNDMSIFFGFFMSVWSVVFLECWKRYQAELAWNWDVYDLSETTEEDIRPDFQSTVKTTRINPVTQIIEPYMSLTKRTKRVAASLSAISIMMIVALGILTCIILYRIVGEGLYYQMFPEDIDHRASTLATSITASTAKTVCIIVLGLLYQWLAEVLTRNEIPRTEQEFEYSYTYKIFIFEFVNHYGAITYTTLFRGKLMEPTSEGLVDRCDPVGCFKDVTILLAIILLIKMIVSNISEIGKPLLLNWWKRRKNVEDSSDNKYTRWEKDFDLQPHDQLGLVSEYLEMIIQYGFITMFCTAFPLAPLLAFLNNVIEIRLDAYKITTQHRRPVPARAQNIGAWHGLLETITRIAVLTNAFLIAFTSDFIDRLVYYFQFSPDRSTRGYVRHVFSRFNTSSYVDPDLATSVEFGNLTSCYYRDYRHEYHELLGLPDNYYETVLDHDHSVPYARTSIWWHVLVARLFFVLVFENVIFLIQGIIQYIIPDVPEKVKERKQREAFLSKQALYNHAFEAELNEELIRELIEEDHDLNSASRHSGDIPVAMGLGKAAKSRKAKAKVKEAKAKKKKEIDNLPKTPSSQKTTLTTASRPTGTSEVSPTSPIVTPRLASPTARSPPRRLASPPRRRSSPRTIRSARTYDDDDQDNTQSSGIHSYSNKITDV